MINSDNSDTKCSLADLEKRLNEKIRNQEKVLKNLYFIF